MDALAMKPGARVGLGDLIEQYVLRLAVPPSERGERCEAELALLRETLNHIEMLVDGVMAFSTVAGAGNGE